MVNSVFLMLVQFFIGDTKKALSFFAKENPLHKGLPVIYSRPTTFTTNESLVVVDSLKHGYLMLIAKKKTTDHMSPTRWRKIVQTLHPRKLTLSCLKKDYSISIGNILPETNIAPENRPSQKESSLSTIHFQVPGRVHLNQPLIFTKKKKRNRFLRGDPHDLRRKCQVRIHRKRLVDPFSSSGSDPPLMAAFGGYPVDRKTLMLGVKCW